MLITELNHSLKIEGHSWNADEVREERNMTAIVEPSELELSELIHRAQDYDQDAIDELYKRFRGMILNEIKFTYVQETLGEDAENIAWEAFYRIVMDLKFNRPRIHIAGLLKIRLHDRLINIVRETVNPNLYDSLDEIKEEGFQIADTENKFTDLINNVSLEKGFNKLPAIGKKLLRMFYFEDKPLDICAKAIGRSYMAANKLKMKCLRQLEKNLITTCFSF